MNNPGFYRTVFRIFLPGLFLVSAWSSCKHEIPLPAVVHDTTQEYSETGCDPDSVYFQNTILPIFVSNCAQPGCHSAASHEEGIILDNYFNIIGTGEIEPYKPGHGDIVEVISTNDPDDAMPPPSSGVPPLTAQQINWIVTWINQGAQNNSCNECDTSAVTYSKSIAPLISAKCKGCHQGTNPGGGILLTSYAGVRAIAANGKLSGSVNHVAGYSAMPKGAAKLPDCDIAKLRIWIDEGYPNN
jgi:hypothetical protein